MLSRISGLSLLVLLALSVVGCNNTLNPLCSSARPVPVIGSLAPSSLTFAQVQQGAVVTVNGSQFVSSSQVLVNGKSLAATVLSPTQMKVTLTTGVIAAPGTANIAVQTPSGSSSDVGCSSGGTSSTLVMHVN
jgi:hypothetical protein